MKFDQNKEEEKMKEGTKTNIEEGSVKQDISVKITSVAIEFLGKTENEQRSTGYVKDYFTVNLT
jgi:hypothetical protein